jgi:hypothetical protein
MVRIVFNIFCTQALVLEYLYEIPIWLGHAVFILCSRKKPKLNWIRVLVVSL